MKSQRQFQLPTINYQLTTRILALSSSRAAGGAYLETARPMLQQLLGARAATLAFIPFASVDNDGEAYTQKVREALEPLPYKVETLGPENAGAVLERADAVLVGGGNTFKLLHDLYAHGLVEELRKRVQAGLPYVGWSAGANLTGRTIGTTNDMPILQPESFRALGFFPFQINPHYRNETWEGFHGETRDQRLTEFTRVNPGIPVLGLPEGSALIYQQGKLEYRGTLPGAFFLSADGTETLRHEISPGEDLTRLLE